jgi:hypothetical protein
MTLDPTTIESSQKKPYHIEKLGLPARIAHEHPDMWNAYSVGNGGEGEVYRVKASDLDQKGIPKTGNIAVKVFYPPKPESLVREAGESQEIFKDRRAVELSKSVMATAGNARFADRIYDIDCIKREINYREDQLRDLGYSGYHLRELQESFARPRDVNLHGFLNFLYSRAQQRGLYRQAQDIAQKMQGIHYPKGFRGGLATYINHYVKWASSTYPSLQLPAKIFPDMYQFGKFPQKNYFTKDGIAGSLYLVMAYIPDNLDGRMYETLEALNRRITQAKRDLRWEEDTNKRLVYFQEMAQELGTTISPSNIAQVQTMLHILASMGLTFADLKRGNIGFTKENQCILLDPSALIKTGALQDICTFEYLPPYAQQQAARGMLRGNPANDQFAFQKILRDTQGAILEQTKGLVDLAAVREREQAGREEASIRAARRRRS